MFPPRILIAGCGYLGTRLGREFISRGSQVYGLRRSVSGPQVIPMPEGITQILANLTRPETLKPLPEVDLVVFCQAPGKHDAYEKTYLEGTKNLLAGIGVRPHDPILSRGSDPYPQVIFVSSTSVYSTADGSWVDETTDPRQPGHPDLEAGKRAEVLLQSEEAVLNSGLPAKVVRLSGIYGPNRNRVNAVRVGAIHELPLQSDQWMNRIRVDDAVSAILTVVDKGKFGEIYIGSDDQPSTEKEFYEWLHASVGATRRVAPTTTNASIPRQRGGNKRCRNAKLRALGWAPQYPSYKEGYADLLAAGA